MAQRRELLVADEDGAEAAQRLWLETDHVVCAAIGYVEARAALAAATRAGRLDHAELELAKVGLDDLCTQMDHVPVTNELLVAAGPNAETEPEHLGSDRLNQSTSDRTGRSE